MNNKKSTKTKQKSSKTAARNERKHSLVSQFLFCIHMNSHAGFCEVTPPVVVISDVFDVELCIAFIDSVGPDEC